MATVQKEKISLDFYKFKYKEKLEEYYLPEEQQKYTSLPADALAICETDSERTPVVILYNQTPAGFFVLHGWEGVKSYSDNRNAILLRAYSVNANLQGKGIATQSIQLLPSFVKENFPDKNEIVLGVNHLNKRAQCVYQSGGFKDKGIRAMGKNGELYILHLEL
ncbi:MULTISPECIES: GNAT family N-acetyltransferase [Bacillaceae]|uniref:GNAT family N-acetyltransferase n=1 Tax=Bacillaceae TaxID=186817 RepID=UPI000E75307B|nr:GNAT family N-acetyltransferase [Bacillus sp. PK3_68]RJS58986.1 GNAT family N-acetyltransferase [Bacillus sp. PK3_68]